MKNENTPNPETNPPIIKEENHKTKLVKNRTNDFADEAAKEPDSPDFPGENAGRNDKEESSEPKESPNEDGAKEKKKGSLKVWLTAAVCVLAVAVCASLYLANPNKAGSEIKTRTITMTDLGFDTPVTFKTTCSEEQFNDYLSIIKSTYGECNELFDAFNTYDGKTSLKTVNEKAHDQPVTVDEKVIEVLNDSIKAHQVNPKFDVSQGKLTFLWKQAFDSGENKLPDAQAIAASINPDSMNAVVVEDNTISLTDQQAALDFGAIAKGYTTQLCADRLQEAGLEYGFLNAGGNVVLIGEKPDGEDWKVGIQNPDESDSLLLFTTRKPTCLVTSGDYQRYMMVDGKRYSHIIDPDTGYPAAFMRSVTVIHDDSAYCDAMSTALFCMPVEEGLQLCKEMNLEAVFITDKGSLDLTPSLQSAAFDIYLTDGLKDAVKLKENS